MPIPSNATRPFKQTGIGMCHKHGEHSNWRINTKGFAACRECDKQRSANYRKRYPEVIKRQTQERTIKDPIGEKLRVTRNRCKLVNRVFEITKEEIINLFIKQNRSCALTGRPITEHQFSIDRIDSTKGYILDNVWLTTVEANYMKMDMPLKEFVSICKAVAATYGSK